MILTNSLIHVKSNMWYNYYEVGDDKLAKFNPGDRVYIIESSHFIVEVEIVKYSGGFYLIKYPKQNGGYKVRESRLYKTKEEAEKNKR